MMMTPEPDMQQRLVDALTQEETDPPEFASLLDPFQYAASANYVVPMLLDLALKRGNEIVDHAPAYSSLDHAVNWQVLVAAIARFDAFAAPYFEWALLPDPFAEELLSYEWRKHQRRHVVASFEHGLWRLCTDSEGLRVSLTKPARRSALHLVGQIAERALHPPGLSLLIDQAVKRSGDLSELALTAGTFALDIFAQAAPASWQSLCAGLGFPIQMLPPFRAWAIALDGTGRRWFSMPELWDDWTAFAAKRPA